MVKTLKKAIAVLICVLMVVTSLPFTAITAQAGTTTVANTLFEYTFDNGSLTDTTGSNALTVQGWNTGNNVANSDNYYFDDGGCYGAVSSSIKGLDNWKITYQGYSTQNLDSSKQSGSCEIGLGTASGNTNIVYVSSYGHIYSNGSLLETGSLNSASMNIIVLEYNNGSLTVTMNGTAYGPYSVDSSLFTNVSYLYTGVDSAISIGSHVHYVYDITATTDVTVQTADETYEVFGNVTIDPIVYICGSTYTSFGNNVADGSTDGELSTSVSTKKTIDNVQVTDTTDGSVTVSNGKLVGSLGGGYGNVKTYDTDSTVTLKFVFTDGTYEYHKLPVKPNPVASHVISALHDYYFSWGSYRYPVMFEVLAKGSYGYFSGATTSSTGYATGTYSSSNSGATKNKGSSNGVYASLYSPYSSSYPISESNYTLSFSGMQSTDKNAGYYAWDDVNTSSNITIYTSAPTATYYLDLSLGNQQGVTHTKDSTSYSLNLIVSSLYFSNTDSSSYNMTKNSSSCSRTSGSSTMSITTEATSSMSVHSSSSSTITVGGTASTGTSFFNNMVEYYNGKSYIQATTPIQLVVSNKKTQRDQYATIVTEASALRQACYTEASWETYRNAILKLEEWLNDNTDTSDGSSLVTAVNTAKSNLTPKTDASAHDVVTTTTPATCATASTEKYTCSYCSWTGTDTHNTPATGNHDYDRDNPVATTTGNCSTQSTATYKCKNCEATITEDTGFVTDAHSWGDWTHADGQTHQRVCANDASHTETGDCTAGEWTLVSDTATCTADGVKTYTSNCTVCSGAMTKTEESSATQHAWGEWTHDTDSEPSTHTRACANASCPEGTQTESCSFDENDVASTCTELGYTEYTCSVCSYSYKVYKTELAPHDYDETNPVETVAGNCTDAGYVIYKCKNCEETEKVDTGIVADKHDYTETTTQPTCTQNGYITYSCAYNSDHNYTEYPEDLKATGHDYDYDNGVVKTPATCSSKGTTTYSCKDCDDTIDVEDIEIDPDNHNYEPDPSLSVDPTCTEDGYDVEVCSYNPDHTNKVYPDEIKATGHKWNDGVVKTPATCSAKGVTLYTCEECGTTEEREDIEINPDAHNWNDGEVTSATCTKAGYTTYTCLNNEEHTNVVAGDEATGHTYSAWVSDQNGQHTKTCTKNCGEEGATVTENCTLDFAEVVKEATCVDNAVAKYTCAECGYSENREVPDTATNVHTAGEWADVEGSNTATCENAGTKQQTTACTVCGEEMTQTVDTDALGHAYPDTWTHVADSQTHQKVCANDPTHIETADCDYKVTESKAADCVNDGYEVYTCADCGDSYTETLTANGHDYADEPFETVEGDCTTAGHKSYKCKYCDDVNTVSTGTVTDNHNWNEGVVTPATCTQAGYTTYTCLNNEDHTKVEDVVEATGHTYGDLVSNEDGTHTKTCTKNCGEEGETVKEDCTLVKGDVVTEATCVANEVATYTCECGYSVEQEVAGTATGVHTPGTAKKENEVAATFDAPGSYDKVTYCKVCNEVLETEHVETPQKVAVCVIGDERYATLSSAISASTAGDTITLVSDITLTSYVTVASTKSVTIDFAGYTVYAKTLGILVLGDLTLTDSTGDNGGIVAANAQGDGQAVQVGRAVKPAVSYPNAKLTINGGRYYVYGDHDYAQTHALSSSGNVVIANCTLDTDVVINGGVFSSEEGYTINGKYLVLNTNQTTGAYGGFVVNGGTFVNYNPADGDDSDIMNDTLGEKKFLSEDAVYEIVDGNYVVVTGDYDAYNAALETQSEVETDGCTAESIEAYNNEVEEAKNELAAATTQQAIDLATKKLEEAQSLLVKVSGFKVTINVVADDNADIDVDAITDLAYGDTATVDLVDALAGYTITKWTVIQDNATSKLAMANKIYEMVVTGDTDITVYVSKTPEDTSNYKKVIVIDRNEKKLGTAYIEKAQDVDLTADAIAGIEAPSLAFYEFKAWEVLTNSDTSIMVKATYTAPGVSCNVHFLDGLTFNGVSEYEAYYDETLSVDTDAKLAIATKEDRSDAVAITNNDSIHTPKANDAYIFIVEDTTTLASTAITGIYYKNSKASFNMIYSLPEGAELVECGAYVVGSDEENVDGYDFDVTDSFKIRSQSQSSNGEYTISVQGVTSFKTVYAKSYVVYVLDGQQITQTSNAVGITVN